MKLVRDTIQLDNTFPFGISEVVLNRENSHPEMFHWHSYFEITCVLEGKGRYLVNGQEYSVSAGDLLIFNNVEPHSGSLIQEEMRLLVMIFNQEFVADNNDLFDYAYLRPLVERGSNFRNRISSEENVNKEIRRILKEILQEKQDAKDGYRLMIKADVLRILTLLSRYCQDENKSNDMLKEKKNTMRRLETALQYIEQHYCERITLEETAAAAFMSPNYFSTYFRRVMNESFSEYVNKQRIYRVKELLRDEERSVTETALECGFHNLSNFYRMYKKYVGKSPREKGENSINSGKEKS